MRAVCSAVSCFCSGGWSASWPSRVVGAVAFSSWCLVSHRRPAIPFPPRTILRMKTRRMMARIQRKRSSSRCTGGEDSPEEEEESDDYQPPPFPRAAHATTIVDGVLAVSASSAHKSCAACTGGRTSRRFLFAVVNNFECRRQNNNDRDVKNRFSSAGNQSFRTIV